MVSQAAVDEAQAARNRIYSPAASSLAPSRNKTLPLENERFFIAHFCLLFKDKVF